MIPDAVRERFPWPELPSGLQPFVVNMDGGGRYLIDRLNEKHRVTPEVIRTLADPSKTRCSSRPL